MARARTGHTLGKPCAFLYTQVHISLEISDTVKCLNCAANPHTLCQSLHEKRHYLEHSRKFEQLS